MSRNKKPSSVERRNRKQLNNQSRQTEYAQMEHGLRDNQAENISVIRHMENLRRRI